MRRILRPDVRLGYRIPLNAYYAQAHRDLTLDRQKARPLYTPKRIPCIGISRPDYVYAYTILKFTGYRPI
jgi:hypothetical protein